MAKQSGTMEALFALTKFLPRKRIVQLQILMLLMLVGALAETITIGAIAPFLGLITKPDMVASWPVVKFAMGWFSWTDPRQLIIPIAIVFATVVFLAGVVRIILAYANNKFSHRIGYDLGLQIYGGLLYKPYSEHVLDNTSTSLSGMNKVTQVVANVVKPMMVGTSSLVIAIFIVVAMMMVDFYVAMSAAGIFGGIYLIVTLFTRGPLRRNSVKTAQSQTRRFKVLQEGLGGIRDVILDHAQPVYIEKFKKADRAFKDGQATNAFIGAAPRYIIESTGMIGIVFFATYVSGTRGGLLGAIPILGALALGAQRLMPLLQQIFLSWSQVMGSHQELHDVLSLLRANPLGKDRSRIPDPIGFDRAITIENLSYRYTPSTPWVLNDINLVIKKGSRVGFIGKTGSGKSTLIDLVMGLLEPTSGTIRVDDLALDAKTRQAWQRRIAHVPQSIFLVDDTIAANIAFGREAKNIDMDAIQRASKHAELSEHIENQPDGYMSLVGERGIRLSGGQRQRIGIARALYKGCDLLVLDEATSALDNETEASVMASINGLSRDLTILVIAHRLSTLSSCDYIVELDGGNIVRVGTYNELVLNRSLAGPVAS